MDLISTGIRTMRWADWLSPIGYEESLFVIVFFASKTMDGKGNETGTLG